MSVKYFLHKSVNALLSILLMTVLTSCTQTLGTRITTDTSSPPSLDSFTAPFKDPLNADPNHQLQYPVNLFDSTEINCIAIDNILDASNAQIAQQKLESFTQQRNEQGEPLLSLQIALDLGLCHNPQMRMTWSDIKLEASKVGQSKAAYLPQINASFMPQSSTTKTHSSFFGISTGTSTETVKSTSSNVGLSWRIFDFGTRSATLESAYYQLASATHSQNDTLQKTIIDILQRYYDALTKKSQWIAQKETTILAEQTLASTQRKANNGAGARNDILQAQSSLSKNKLEETKALGEYQKALASLIFVLGLPANTKIDLDNTLEQDMQAMVDEEFKSQQNNLVEQGLQDWLNQARYAHPAIAAARAKWMSSQAELRAVSAQGLPTVDLGANYYRNGRPTDRASSSGSAETSVSLTLNIPIFSGFEHTYRVRGAQAQVERGKLEMEAVEQQVMLDIIQTYVDAQSAWKNLTEAETFYTAALQASESSKRQFDGGVVDITQVIQSQNFLIDARIQRINAYAQWQIARMSLIVQSYAW